MNNPDSPLIKLDRAISLFENISYQSLFLIDCKSKKIINDSKKLKFIIELHNSTDSCNDTDICIQDFISNDEFDRISSSIRRGLEHLGKYKLKYDEFTFFFNCRLSKKFRNVMANVKFNFFNISDPESYPEYALCCIAIGSHNETSKDIMKHFDNKTCFVYENGLWKSMTIPVLTILESDIIILASKGYSIDEIADTLMKSTDTIKGYRRSIFEKFGAKNITQAITIARNYHLI